MKSLKIVDDLITQYGISAFARDTPFVKRARLSNQNASLESLPFCFYRKIDALADNEFSWCFSVYIPNKKQKLAMYLVDQHHNIIEQVYYPRDRRSVMACQKVQRLLEKSLAMAKSEAFELAA